MALSQKTAELVKMMQEMKEGQTFHPVIFSNAFCGRNASVAPAIRVAKEFGFIEVAYMNTDNQPVYVRTGSGVTARP